MFGTSVRAAFKRGVIVRTQAITSQVTAENFIKNVHGIRYQVKDVARAVAFYTQHLGLKLEHQHLPAFASLSLGDTDLFLSGPGASRSRRMPTGETQQPGGWNRIVLKVSDLPACIAAMRSAGPARLCVSCSLRLNASGITLFGADCSA
jgi:glyoxylase I family protein